MITSKEEYLSSLAGIQQAIQYNKYIPIPSDEKIYKINLNTREVEAPQHLSVTSDKEAEILFFEVDRFFDLKDLLQTTCLIFYTNALNESFVYPVPCMDYNTKRDENKILIPWVINSDVTWKAGTVKFAFQFYEMNTGTLEFLYQLNTLPATTKVLQGFQFNYSEANDLAAADNKAGKWGERYQNYFIKTTINTGNFRYTHASPEYNKNETYYIKAEEPRISDATKLEAIYQKIDELQKSVLKWVEI